MFVNDKVGEPHHAVQIREGESLRVACYVNGNPDPNITLSKEAADSITLQRNMSDWLNHSIKSSQCSDMGTYKCTGTSKVFPKREKTFRINVTCKLYIISVLMSFRYEMRLDGIAKYLY